tara:strand:- start:240 stop:1046 length:807 start_codon:yes stop_codon:yes gene_type:complete
MNLDIIINDKMLIIYIIVISVTYYINIFLFNKLKKCKTYRQTNSMSTSFDNFIKFVIYSIFIYIFSNLRTIINEDNILQVLFIATTILTVFISNMFTSDTDYNKLYSTEKIDDLKGNIDSIKTQDKLVNNILQFLKNSAIIIVFILFIIYNIYSLLNNNTEYDNKIIYFIKLCLCILIISIYILLYKNEGDVITNDCSTCSNEEKCVKTVLQFLNIKPYFIAFLASFIIVKDRFNINVVIFGIILGIYIDNASRYGIETNIHTIPQKK